MDIRTYRARSMPQALELVRQELGPAAMVLHTRELNRGLLRRAMFGKQYEVAATADETHVAKPRQATASPRSAHATQAAASTERQAPSAKYAAPQRPRSIDSSLLKRLRSELIDADVDPAIARDLIEQLAGDPALDQTDPPALRAELTDVVARDLRCSGPIRLRPGHTRFVALVGPTGVGKTTTVAKLAANFRLRDDQRVGLITVDTYRIAAVEQLRTYAEIIDLPMEVVGSPHEMRAAVERMRDFDLVLMDTAGRSPRDEVRIRELRTMLAEAQPDEVHLVLSAASSRRHLAASVEQFSTAGVTSLLVTKLDEAAEFGSLLSLARQSRLPFSYVTDGQDVPDDIAVAESNALAKLIVPPIDAHATLAA